MDDLVIDVGAVAVSRGPERLAIPDLSFATLACLVRRAPDVVSQEDLVGEVWEGMAVSDETIKQRITLLRKALGDDWREPRYIRSVRGRGYQLVPKPEPLAATDEPTGAAGSRRGTRLFAALVVVGLAVGAIAVHRWRRPAPPAASNAEPRVSSSDLVSRGRDYFNLHREEDNERAIRLFEQALQDDPDDSEALAGLSKAYSQRAAKFNQPVTWGREAETLARRAIELDPERADNHHALGFSLDSQGRLSSALASYRRAAELDPGHLRAIGSGAYVLYVKGALAEALEWDLSSLGSNSELHYVEVQIAETLAALGFTPTAEAWFQKAVTLRPENLFAAISYAAFRLGRGDLAGAEELLDKAAEAGVERPELFELGGHLALMQGDVERADRLYREALAVTPRSAASVRLLALAVARDPATFVPEAKEEAEAMESGLRDGNEWPPSGLDLAILATALDDRAAAFAAIDRAIELGYRDSAWLLVDPALAALREDAGFWTRVERIRELTGAERARVLAADWLPDGFLDAAR